MNKLSQTRPTNNTPTDCRFCSAISKANGEDPIGTARTCDYLLIIEIPQPWLENSTLKSIFSFIIKYKIKLKPIAIAPDREYSLPGYTRVIYYYRPGELFAEYEKQEYLVPDALMNQLVISLLKQLQQQPNELANFQQYQQQTSKIREMLVCTHANVDVACGRFGYPIYKKLRSEYAAASQGNLRVWRCSHFGGHQFAPTLVDLPEGRYWGHLEPEILDLLVWRNASVSGLRQFYRGWAGLNSFEQIAEREIWMQEGWDWLKYRKAGQVLAFDEERLKHLEPESAKEEATWALVRLEFVASDDSNLRGVYEARVEVRSQVMSALCSGDDMELTAVKQYDISCLVKVNG